MNRVAYILVALGLMAISIRPLLSSSRRMTHGDTAQAISTPGSVVRTAAPLSEPIGPRQFVHTRGKAGFWRLGQDSNGVWWLLDGKDQPEFINAVTTVQPALPGRDANGPSYTSRDCQCDAEGKCTNIDAWAKATLDRVHSTGFRALGAWCNPIFHNYDVPMTRDLNVWTWEPSVSKRLYSPTWATVAEEAIKSQVSLLKDNRNLIGYFTDNELDWGEGFSGPGVYFDFLPKADPNRVQVISLIHKLWPTVDEFNRDWQLSIKSFDEVDAWTSLPHDPQAAYTKLFNAWVEHLATDYFRVTTALVRKYDPNHLVLGVRFRGYAPPEVVRASRDYTDAQSINYYVGDARLDYEMFKMMNDSSGQPIIISEYSFNALDGRSGNRNTVGFAAQVLDQQARAEGYKLFTQRMARVPWIVSADWFQWMDEPPSGRTMDGEDVNFGVVDIDDRPYDQLVDAIRETASSLDPLHYNSFRDEGKDVWRESFAQKPVMHVPYLHKPPVLNGELSDWAPQCKLQDVKLSQTIGLERSKLPLPNIYLGWTEKGLYVGMEVFDEDILSAPAKGWWWTRDCAELWINTTTPQPDQITYSKNSHSFFFVPNPFPDDEEGTTGVVGQWHRPGDALTDSLIPDPLVKCASRIRPDRYVVEMFIPKEAMYGWDPKQPMALNIHVKNFQHATEYYWSAPKEMMTQLRPNTWGTMILDPAANSVAIVDPRAK